MSAWKKPSRKAWRRKFWITARQRRQVVALGGERGVIVERRAVDPFEREHLAPGAVPVDGRHAEAFVGARILRHFRERGGLQAEIHFDRDRARQRRHDLDQPQALRFEREAFRRAGGEEEGVEIGAKAPLDAGPQDLHRHRLARAVHLDFGAVHLRDRGGGDRGAEAGVDGGERFAQADGDGGLRFGLRERRHLVLQAFEIARDVGADHVGAGGEELAELDVSRPQPAERGGQPALAGLGARPLEEPGQCDRGLRQAVAAAACQRARTRPRARTRSRRAPDARMREPGDHKRQPECNATTPPVI